ncbi:SseB protein [Pseudolysobacter antarcticus]|uniref:SseB protein n=1 Tax=Pseudolysobacter antarcticus TaxID=2511995 RepID=A0A411HJM2_9GAMM|nr:enhanced serine sensitivity protein SseB C-terminal domain-containing protein [Pseudolysobacter antarcticus]QBB70705.1 SseB protein [Pseudolysobacter antarcticus]
MKNERIYVDSPLTGSDIPPAKISLDELERLRLRAIEHRDEVPFFRALLDANLYAHTPLSDDSGRLRLIQFPHPDTGQELLPVFTDAAQSHAAAQGLHKVLVMPGRDLFELTLGATLIINPNRDAVTLYPEEIRELLETGVVAHIDVETLQEPITMAFRQPVRAPDWMEEWLRQLFAQLPYIESAYLVEMFPPDAIEKGALLIAVGVTPANTERAGRAITTKLQPKCEGLQVAVELMPFDPAGELPNWVGMLGVQPIYERAV